MKKKFIGIPIFLYLLLSVNITTCAPKAIPKKEDILKPSNQEQASTKPSQKAHPKFKKAIHEEYTDSKQCILKQIASDSRIDIADHKTIIENYANLYLNKTEPCQSPACDTTACKNRLKQIKQITFTQAENDLIKQAIDNALKKTSPEVRETLRSSGQSGDIEIKSIKTLLRNTANLLARKQ